MLDPAGPVAFQSAEIWWVMLTGAGVIFVTVMALVAIAFTGWRERLALPPRHWLLWAGLVFPAVTLSALFIYSRRMMEGGEADICRAALRIEVQARQWEWRVRYPDSGNAETIDVLHLPAGVPVEIVLRSEDVIHSFWIPRLAGKMDVVPGHVNVINLVAPEAGDFYGQCSEFCGTGHAGMALLVRVSPPSQYRALLAAAPLSPNEGGR